MSKKVNMIAAVAQNGVMGDADTNKLPWHYPEDFKRFKAITSEGSDCQGTIVMGRRTWLSIGQRPLPKRRNIVVSTVFSNNGAASTADLVYASSLEDAIEKGTDNIWICGGSAVYEHGMKYAGLIDLTIVPDAPQLKNPVRFPWINPLMFKMISSETEDVTITATGAKLVHARYAAWDHENLRFRKEGI